MIPFSSSVVAMHIVVLIVIIVVIFAVVFVAVIEILSEVFITVIKILSVQKILCEVFGTELLDVIAASVELPCLLLSATCTHTQW